MFLFKKILAPFLFPLSLCSAILVVGLILLWFTRRQRAGKIFISVGVLFLLTLSYGVLFEMPLASLEYRYLALKDPGEYNRVKWVVVLGGGHVSDPRLPVTGQISKTSLMRLVEGIRIYKKIPQSKLILSGGPGFDPVPNARIMADIALILGIEEKDIVSEETSQDTRAEALQIKKLVKNDDFILVTTAAHMPRAMALFKKVDLNPIPAPIDYAIRQSPTTSPMSFFPHSSRIAQAENLWHEYLGLAWAKLRGQI